MRHIIGFLVFVLFAYGQSEDITIPMNGGGNIVIHDPHFISVDQFNTYEPTLTFSLVNNATVPWTTLDVFFDIGGFCKDELHQWSISTVLTPPKKAAKKI